MLRSSHELEREQGCSTQETTGWRLAAAGVLLALLGLSGPLFAANSIGVNFASGRNNGVQVENVTGSAGVVPMANWNNVLGITGTDLPLIDSNGAPSAATMTFTGVNNPYAVYAGAQPTQDGQLLNSYLDTSAALPTITFTFNNIPYTNYIVYVYVGSDGGGRVGRLNVGGSTVYFTTIGGAAPFAGYVQATATTFATSTMANYAVFNNLSGSSLTFTHNREATSNNTGVCGIEIVEDPVSIWTGAANNVWANVANWIGPVPGATAGTTNPDTAVFNSAGGANPVPIVDANRNLFRINFSAAPGNLTLGTTGGNALLMTDQGRIQILPAFTGTSQAMTINAPIRIEGAAYTFLNNAPDPTAVLNFGGAISGDAVTSATLTIGGSNTGANTISGIISNGSATPLGLTKAGAGTWVLTRASTFSGPTTISAGTLQLGNGTTGNDGSLATSPINSNAVLIVNNFGAVNLGGAISGTGSLTKTGPGLATVPQGTLDTYSGATTINGGGLRVIGSLFGSGTTTVGGAAATGTPALSGRGTIAGPVIVNGAGGGAAGHVAPGNNTSGNSGTIDALGTGPMTLNAGAVLDFDLGTPGSGVPSTGGASDTISINGNLNLPASGTITVNLFDNAGAGGAGTIGNGTYKLFTFTGQVFNFTATSFTIGTTPLPAGRAYIFSAVAGEIDLTIAAGVQNLTWNGNASNVWDAVALNWHNGTANVAYTDSLSTTIFQDAKGGGGGNVTNNGISVRAAGVSPISVTFNNVAVPYTFSNASGAVGISGPTGLTLAGAGTVTLQSPNTYSGATILNAGRLNVSNNTSLGSATGSIAPLTFNGGTLGYATGATGTDVSSRTVTINAGGATIDTNGLTVTYAAGIGNSGSGGLTLNDTGATAGRLVLAGPSTYTGLTTVTRGTLQIGNGTTDGALVGNTVNNGALVFNVAGTLNYNSVISGTGGLTKLGTGTLSLGGANTYSGITTDTAGVIVLRNKSALGTNKVVLNGGGLRLQSDNAAFGINFVTGRNGTEMYGVTGTAGVVPVGNWNNAAGLTGTGVALNGSDGLPNGALLNWTGAATTYSTYGAAQADQNAQLVNSYLDQTADNVPMTITISNLPFQAYRVYVYVNSDGTDRHGHITVGNTSYYFSTVGNVPFAGFTQATSTTPGTFTRANYCLFDNVLGSTLTVTHFRDQSNCGICGIEIVSNSLAPNNNVDVTANSSIDITGAGYGQLGNLNMGSQILAVLGQSVAVNANYVLALGASTLTGNPTFNVANNGTGSGSLSLGPLDDGGTARTITLPGAGALTLTAPAVSLVTGTQFDVNGGTLNANEALALGINGRVMLGAATASLRLNASVGIAALNSAANAGTVVLGANNLTVGNAENLVSNFGGAITGAGNLVKAGTGALTLSGASTFSGTSTVNAGKLVVTGTITGAPTSGAVQIGGATATGTPTLSGTGTVSGTTTIDGAAGGAAGHLAPGVNPTGSGGAIGTLNTGPLILNGGAVLDFDFGTPGTGLPPVGGLSDLIAVTGDVTFPLAGSVTINLINNNGAGGQGSLNEGTYRLFTFTGSAVNFSSASSLTVGTTPLVGKTYIFSVIGNEVDLIVASGIAPLTWTGNASNLWNTTAINWFNTSTNTAVAFADNGQSVVTFQDAKLPAGGGNVLNSNISIQAAGVRPAALSFINTSGGVPYTISNASGTIGIAGNTGLQVSDTGTVALQSPNTYTGPTSLIKGKLQIKDNSSLGAASAPVSFNGGALGYLPAATNTDISTRQVTIGAAGGTIDPNGQTITFFGPIGNSGTGALTLNDSNPVAGKLIVAAANTNTGGTTITAGTLQVGDGLVDGALLGNITNNAALIYNTVGAVNYSGAISGTGTLSKVGAGTLTLSGNSSYSGDTNVTAGTLSAQSSTALGTGFVNLSNSTLQLAAGTGPSAIGINFVTGRNGTENYAVTGPAGVVPISNWNNLGGLTGANAALTYDTGTASGATATWAGAATTYSTYGVAQGNQDAQLVNSYLDATADNVAMTITVSNVPFASYRVFVYVNSDGTARQGHITCSGTSYYFSTIGNVGFGGFIQATSTTPGTFTPSNYCVFEGVSGSTLTVQHFRDGTNCGICGVEIVGTRSMPNNVVINQNSTIEVSGIAGATMGGLTIGSRTLSVKPGATVTNMPYRLNFGATSLTGSPTLNIASDGTGIGTLTLGAINDNGALRIIEVNAGGATVGSLTLTSSAVSAQDLMQLRMNAGVLRLNASNVLGAYPIITLASTATMDGGGQLFSGAVRGTGTLAGTIVVLGEAGVTKASAVWPGTALSSLTPLGADETMTVATGANIELSLGGKLKLIVTTNGGTVRKQSLFVNTGGVITGGGASTLSLGIGAGTYAGTGPGGGTDIPLIVANLGNATMTSKFTTVNGLPPGWSIVYRFGNLDLAGDPAPGTPADTVVLRTTSAAVTPATLTAFAAQTHGAGVELSWDCVSEFQNAGFNLYRRGMGSDAWKRINPALIAGRVTNPDAKHYSWYDWSAPGSFEYKLETVSIHGVAETYGHLAGPVCVDALSAELAIDSGAVNAAKSGLALMRENLRGAILSAKFGPLAEIAKPATGSDGMASAPQAILTRANSLWSDAEGKLMLPAAVRALPGDSRVAARAQSALSGNATSARDPAVAARWFSGAQGRATSYAAAKVVYDKPGVLLIPRQMLPAGFDVRHLTIQREGRALTALAMTEGGLIAYGQGYQDEYTKKDALFLRNSRTLTAAGQAVRASGLFAGTQAASVTTPAAVTAEYHDVYFDFDFRPYTFAPWFSEKYLAGGTTQSFTLDAPHSASGTASLTVNLWSLTQTEGVSADHALQVFVNGRPAGQASWSGGNKMMQFSFQLGAGVLLSGENKIELITPELEGVPSQIALLHSMTLGYTQKLDASGTAQIVSAGAGSKVFEASNLPTGDAWVVDARYPDRAALLPYETQSQADGTYKLRFNAPAGGSGRFLIVPAGQENVPLSVTKRTIKPVKAAAYLAVGPSQFGSGVQPLLSARAKEGLRGAFVDQEQIFDYYGFGRYGPAPIQSAVRATRPEYLLLVGRTTYDYNNYSGAGVDPLCPAFLVTTAFWAQSTSDSMFGDLGRGYPEVAVGRLPVNTPAELRSAVQRILSYKGMPASGVRAHAVADRTDAAAGDFGAQANAIAQGNPEIAWQQNYLGSTYATQAEVSAAMAQAASGGADLLLYVGHGNAVHLGKDDPRLLDLNLIQSWTDNVVFLQATCTAHWMAKNETGYKTLATQALTQPQGGIAASVGSSTYLDSPSATEFMNQLIRNATSGSMRWGSALAKTQRWAGQRGGAIFTDLQKTEQLFGDPAMPVFMKGRTQGGGTGTTGGTAPAGGTGQTGGTVTGTF